MSTLSQLREGFEHSLVASVAALSSNMPLEVGNVAILTTRLR
jgi:hypothetical protein